MIFSHFLEQKFSPVIDLHWLQYKVLQDKHWIGSLTIKPQKPQVNFPSNSNYFLYD